VQRLAQAEKTLPVYRTACDADAVIDTQWDRRCRAWCGGEGQKWGRAAPGARGVGAGPTSRVERVRRLGRRVSYVSSCFPPASPPRLIHVSPKPGLGSSSGASGEQWKCHIFHNSPPAPSPRR
jgi:hypothetical protein